MITFVPLDPEHLDAVAKLEATLSPAPWSRALFAGELDLSDDVRHWKVALDAHDQVVAFAGIMTIGDEAHLMNIAVAPTHQGQGLAGRLLVALIDHAVGVGCQHLTLEVRPENAPAMALYRRIGMVESGRRTDYYGAGLDALILWVHHIDRPEYLAAIARDPAPGALT